LYLYEWLCNIAPSPITELNKTVAVMQVHGAEKALEALQQITDKKKLESFYLYHSLLGEIYFVLKNTAEAKKCFEAAMKLTTSEVERKMLGNKISAL
jgi:RNA polymerase sigma-70 factor (ECF subfamily)